MRVVVMGVVLMGLVGVMPAPVAASGTCTERCYQQKSTAYQKCRTLPPGDRQARRTCFRQADNALETCLKSCK